LFPQNEYTQPRGLYQTIQILYLIAAFGVIPDPFATAMDEALLFAPVSTMTLDLSQALNRIPGCLPNAHHHLRLLA
jgi:hypothetical protein